MINIFHNLFRLQKTLHNIPPWEDPPNVPGPGGDPTPAPSAVEGLIGYSVQRYTTNVAITAEMKVLDFINDVLFPASRMFCSQNAKGQLKLQNKKPVTWGLVEETLSVGEGDIDVDNIDGWIAKPGNLILIDPYTTASEINSIQSAAYSAAQNSVTLTSSSNITISGFAGASGSTPATATATIDDTNEGVASNLTLASIAFAFTANSADTVDGIAGFLAAAINANPITGRRFKAMASGDVITIVGKFGILTLNNVLLANHTGPTANPTTAPTAAAVSGGSLPAGDYKLAYSFVNHRGQTLLSPVETVTIASGEKINVSAVTPPAGHTVNWYIQPQPGSEKIRLHSNNDGSSFEINALPLLTATLPPDFNRTGPEIMRVMASFSDRAASRSRRTGSNVIRASYEWLLGNRTKTVNRIDLKYRRALQDYRLIELRVPDLINIAKTKKTSNLEVNGQAIDNDFQAIRIALSLLAEYRDADFFYRWKATRGALLLEEGDVVAITDSGSGVVNLPVMIEQLNYEITRASIPRVVFTGRKYSSSLYDDSITDRVIPTVLG